MKFVGYVFVGAAILTAALYFGGYVEGDANVALTGEGAAVYNSGVQKVQEGVGRLKASSAEDNIK